MRDLRQSILSSAFKVWRPRRIRLLRRLLTPAATDTLLDVGGYPSYWLGVPQFVGRIDTLNLHPVDWDARVHPGYRIGTLVGDACHLSIPDGAYDIAHSNSVVEHVGDWDRQREFAREVRRVGRSVWVQTPARAFPLEPHYLALFLHWLPKRIERRLVRRLSLWGLTSRPSPAEVAKLVDGTRLLT